MISLLRGLCKRVFNRYIQLQMRKNLLIFVYALLIVTLTADLQFTDYNYQETLFPEVNVISLGYSPQQTHVVLTTGVKGQFMMYEGVRLEKPVTVAITDDLFDVSVVSFAFSPDNSMLVIGSQEGSVYGYVIENKKLKTPYKYHKNIGTKANQTRINSISISKENKIAVGAKDQLFVLQIPIDQSDEFTVLANHPFVDQTISSVAWKHNDENFVLVGCTGTVVQFTLYDIANKDPQQINTDETSSIAVFPNGQMFQGRVLDDIQTFTWDDANKKYVAGVVIPDTTYATQMKMSTDGEYFGVVVQINTQKTVLAWKMNTLPPASNNLQNLKLSLTEPTPLFKTAGLAFALSGNGNELLFIKDLTTSNQIKRYALCPDGTYYDNDQCTTCINDCQKCFDATTCLSCPVGWYITVDNKYVSCENVTPGCKTCDDQNTCKTCNTLDNWQQLVDANGVCVCEPTFYESADKCLLCIDTLDFCQLCTIPTQCKQCYEAGHINPIPRKDKCVCIDKWYFDDKNVCQDCSKDITGCVDCLNADQCTLCNEANNFVSDGNGKCICDTGYWLNPTNSLCQLCQTSVKDCLYCQQNGICTICSKDKRIPSKDGKECICQPHTFVNKDELCQDCDPYGQCLQCNPLMSQECLKCDIAKHVQENPKNGICLCEKGYTPGDNPQCVECHVTGCQDCAKAQVCDKCLTDKHFKPEPQSNICVCQDNHYLVDNLTECWTCGQALTGCTKCDNLKECTQCDDSLNFELNADTKLCQCKPSFFEQNKECTLCSVPFKFCLNCNQTTCKQCQDGFSYNQQQNECFCPDDRDFDQDAGKCEQKAGLSALAIIAIIVGILALAGGAVALIKCFKKRQSPLEDDEYEALEGEKDK